MNTEEVTLRQVAIMVWHVWSPEAKAAKEVTEAAQERRIESFRTELQRIIGDKFDINIRINGGCVEAKIEDLSFIAFEIPTHNKQEYVTLVTLLGRCPSCGVATMSEPIYNLPGLGKMLESFEPFHKHVCLRQLPK